MGLIIKNYIEPSGQRNAAIVDSESGLPEFWPTLYSSSQLRAKGIAHSTQQSHLRSVTYLYRWSSIRKIDVESRITSAQGFSRNEIDTLITLLRSPISELTKTLSKSSKVVGISSAPKKTGDIWKTLEAQPKQIKPETYNDRINYVGKYVTWLCDYLSGQDDKASSKQRENIVDIGIGFTRILSSMKSVETNTTFSPSKSINNADIRTILELINPNNSLNPWGRMDVRIRNFAIICILLDTGLRSGELLSLKLKDIIFGKKGAKGLKVTRRQGAKDDPRKIQPSTKRGEREVPLSEAAFKALDLYITTVRNNIPLAAQSEYLFISISNHMLGRPLSSLSSITNKVRDETSINLTPHKLRHTATWRFCMIQKKQGRKWDEFVEQLILKFGWKSETSPSVRHYAKQFIKDQLFEATIREQDDLNTEIEAALDAAKQVLENDQ